MTAKIAIFNDDWNGMFLVLIGLNRTQMDGYGYLLQPLKTLFSLFCCSFHKSKEIKMILNSNFRLSIR